MKLKDCLREDCRATCFEEFVAVQVCDAYLFKEYISNNLSYLIGSFFFLYAYKTNKILSVQLKVTNNKAYDGTTDV